MTRPPVTIHEGLRNDGFQAFYRDGHPADPDHQRAHRWDHAGFQNYYLEGLSYGWYAIVEDRDGDMLVGTDRGINRFPQQQVRAGRGLVWAVGHCDSVVPDPRTAALWSRLAAAELARVRARLAEEGLISKFHLSRATRQQLWMSGPTGAALPIADLKEALSRTALPRLQVLSYGTGDRVDRPHQRWSPACAGGGGELWFPSVAGRDPLPPQPNQHERGTAGAVDGF